MKVKNFSYDSVNDCWSTPEFPSMDSKRTLVLAFGAPELRSNKGVFKKLRAAYPKAVVLGCSSSGEIHGTEVRDHSLAVTVTKFEHTDLKLGAVKVPNIEKSFASGATLAKHLLGNNLKAILILSEGLKVNGNDLIDGINSVVGDHVLVSGGLAGDGNDFADTWVLTGSQTTNSVIAAVGFYGDHFHATHGSQGGWDKFGPERTITKSIGNNVFEIDNKPALKLYKTYLGAKAKDLPASALFFPLAICDDEDDDILVRAVLGVNEEENSLFFTSHLPEGARVQLMKANFDRLVDGAENAAQSLISDTDYEGDTLAVAISCIGRRIVLGDRLEEELEAVQRTVPDSTITGFYSYGELSPLVQGAACRLHNQTMTLTLIGERRAFTKTQPGSPALQKKVRTPKLPPPVAQVTSDAKMVVKTFSYDGELKEWSNDAFPPLDSKRTLILIFGAPSLRDDKEIFKKIKKFYPKSSIVGCSTSGEIFGSEVRDHSLSISVVQFQHTDLKIGAVKVPDIEKSFASGATLAKHLKGDKLKAILILSDGLKVNGNQLIQGINSAVGDDVLVSGGLAGDGTDFVETWVLTGSKPMGGIIVAVGFYGDQFYAAHGSQGGWDKFGPERTITKSIGNNVFEIDGKPALKLYKTYLGAKAKDLPASALFFPLAICDDDDDDVLVRAVLGVNEEENSLFFTSHLPEGARVQLMKANFDRLVDGAETAANSLISDTKYAGDTLALAISCVGRRIVLGDRLEEELEAVQRTVPNSVLSGFYSYGELSPLVQGAACRLHNQTMTLTLFAEVAAATQTLPAAVQERVSTPPSPVLPPPPTETNSNSKMVVKTFSYDGELKEWSNDAFPALDSKRTLVLIFGAPSLRDDKEIFKKIKKFYPQSSIIGCSTSGEIHGTEIKDHSLSISVVQFQHTDLKIGAVKVPDIEKSFASGATLAKHLKGDKLKAILVLSDGLKVNGNQLIQGINSAVDNDVLVSGGLAGDGTDFVETWVLTGSKPMGGIIVAVGFYGDHFHATHGSQGGWDKFGPERTITKSIGNNVFEIDGKPALKLYKTYLGAKAKDLPASALFFPLAICDDEDDDVLVRAVLGVNEEENSLFFTSHLPEGARVQLMKANFDRLVDGAENAAHSLKSDTQYEGDTLALAISCVGRRIVLGDRLEEELEAVQRTVPNSTISGFYSYGELSPLVQGAACRLHNQTMTLTLFGERDTAAQTQPAATQTASAPTLPPPIAEFDSDSQVIVKTFSYDGELKEWSNDAFPALDSKRTLVLIFGAPSLRDDEEIFKKIERFYPQSSIIGCSTSGEIHGTEIKDHSLSISVVQFQHTNLKISAVKVPDIEKSFASGASLAKNLKGDKLKAILVLSDGLKVNGNQLIQGINSTIGDDVLVSGGLAGDGTDFVETWVLTGSKPMGGIIVAVGFYGDHFYATHGSQGGWDKFGPERTITKSVGNNVFEIDGKPALKLYKTYLGAKAKDLPASALFFPLAICDDEDDDVLVRAVLGVNEEENSLFFTSHLPEGARVQLMKANFDRLVDGAENAAHSLKSDTKWDGDTLALAISCVGRRIVLGDRLEEELEAVQRTVPNSVLSGFYSYGELSPLVQGAACRLHNQTMTLTLFGESKEAAQTQNVNVERTADIDLGSATRLVKIGEAESFVRDRFEVQSISYSSISKKWSTPLSNFEDDDKTFVLFFGSPSFQKNQAPIQALQKKFPQACLIGCSTSGEIFGNVVQDDSIVASIAQFAKTDLRQATKLVENISLSRKVGQELGEELLTPDLRAIFILSEGLQVNGSQLVEGLNSVLPSRVIVTGGLSGDGTDFGKTWVGAGPRLQSGLVSAVGFYGNHIRVTHSSRGGWSSFGPERTITKSENNVVFEIDNKPALAFYKKLLGPKADDLPASGLLFPLSINVKGQSTPLVRTLLGVDEKAQSLTFAGDLPSGSKVQLMRANLEHLIKGVKSAAASLDTKEWPSSDDVLGIAVSCVGRRLVLSDRAHEEPEIIKQTIPDRSDLIGFYSYGEISPQTDSSGGCSFHNQTMTLTLFSESETPLSHFVDAEEDMFVQINELSEEEEAFYNEDPWAEVDDVLTPAPFNKTPPPMDHVTGDHPKAAEKTAESTGSVKLNQPPEGWRRPVVLTQQNAGNSPNININLYESGGIQIVELSGQMTETFDGVQLAERLEGIVIFDLVNIVRVTSFGVREWLQMMQAARRRVDNMYLARCSESIVNQLSMIRSFSGNAKTLSLMAPYLCQNCACQYSSLIDVGWDRDNIADQKAPNVECPRCGSESTELDDEPESTFGFLPRSSETIPPYIRAALEKLPLISGSEPIVKNVINDTTRIQINCDLAQNLRWRRILDGVEGVVEFDFSNVGEITPSGQSNFISSLHVISENADIKLESVPEKLLMAISKENFTEVKISSFLLSGRDEETGRRRLVLVVVDDQKGKINTAGDPIVSDAHTGAQVNLSGKEDLLIFTGVLPKPKPQVAPPTPVAETPASAVTPAPVVTPTAVATPAPVVVQQSLPMWAMVLMGLLVLILLVMLFNMMGGKNETPPPVTPPVQQTPPPATPPVTPQPLSTPTEKVPAASQNKLPPAWTEESFGQYGSNFLVVGVGSHANLTKGVKMARIDAASVVLKKIYGELQKNGGFSSLRKELGSHPKVSKKANDLFRSQVGDLLKLSRKKEHMMKVGNNTDITVQYKFSSTSLQDMVSFYAETESLGGATVASLFPIFGDNVGLSEGVMVLKSTTSGLQSGDVIKQIGEQAIFDLASLKQYLSTAPQGEIQITIQRKKVKMAITLVLGSE